MGEEELKVEETIEATLTDESSVVDEATEDVADEATEDVVDEATDEIA